MSVKFKKTSYVEKNCLILKDYAGIGMDSAPWMVDSIKGFASLVNKKILT